MAPAETPPLLEDENEPDPPEFDRDLVPEGPFADYFFDGRTGRGLTNEEYDTTIDRLMKLGPDGVRLANLIRGREEA